MHPPLRLVLTVLVAVAAYLLSSRTPYMNAFKEAVTRRFFSTVPAAAKTSPSALAAGKTVTNMTSSKPPVYFMSHGAPTIMFEPQHPLYAVLQDFGKDVNTKIKPNAIIVVSAHWESRDDVVEVNVSEDDELLYDYYGFPDEFYTVKFPHKGSRSLAQTIMTTLHEAGIRTRAVNRPIDHGVFSPLVPAFPRSNPLTVPLVQVSLYGSSSPALHYALGRALAPLRDRGILLMGSVAAVHNLRDIGRTLFAGRFEPLDYTKSFDEALQQAVVTEKPADREAKLESLIARADTRKAHPSLEHLLPLYVAAGAADGEEAVLYGTHLEGSFSWSSFRFGQVNA